MFRSIPLDVWVAAALAGAVVLFSGQGLAMFVITYLGLCAYIAFQTFGRGRNGGTGI